MAGDLLELTADDVPFAICQECSGPIWMGNNAFAYDANGGGVFYVHRFKSTCTQVKEDRAAVEAKKPSQ